VSNGHAPNGDRSGVSLQTLVVASLASLTAAIVTSTFWRKGAVITAGITPVIVALASELYRRPAERITALGTRAASARTRRGEARSARGPVDVAPPEAGARRAPRQPGVGPVRVYREPARRRLHLKVAIATAAVAFAVALAVLTLPELLFGGSVASTGRTTFFGGKTHTQQKKQEPTTTQEQTQTTPTQTTTEPQAPAQQPTTPTETTAPTQTAPPGGTPAPTTTAPTPP
jgi:hypothetical protein